MIDPFLHQGCINTRQWFNTFQCFLRFYMYHFETRARYANIQIAGWLLRGWCSADKLLAENGQIISHLTAILFSFSFFLDEYGIRMAQVSDLFACSFPLLCNLIKQTSVVNLPNVLFHHAPILRPEKEVSCKPCIHSVTVSPIAHHSLLQIMF